MKVVASGRTDAGVHATGQVIHFDSPLTLPMDRWKMALNVQLPGDIRVFSVEQVQDDFHARYDAIGKTYRYIWSLIVKCIVHLNAIISVHVGTV